MRGGSPPEKPRERGPSGLALVSFCVSCLAGVACAQVRPGESPRAVVAAGPSADAQPRSGAGVVPGAAPGSAGEASEADGPASSGPAPLEPSPEASGAITARPEPPASESAPAKLLRAKLEVGEPRYTAGEVPKAKASVEKLASKLEACVDQNGGLESAKGGSIELQFLVTSRGVAEGVDLRKPSGLSVEALRCMRDLLQKRGVGTPSTDPVGVTIDLRLRAAE